MKRGPVDRVAAERAMEAFLRSIGAPLEEDPELRETPRRVADAFIEDLLAGYEVDPARLLAERTEAESPGLVVVRGIQLATTCPHHLMPTTGVAHVGYLPHGAVVGLGTLGDLVDCFSRRLALQEPIGQSVADALVTHLGARGAACMLEMRPTCMTARGARRHSAEAITLAWAGCFADDPSRRNEFLASLGRRER